jgi:hypothetical protein
MNQKRNKIIVLIGVIILGLILIGSFWYYSISGAYIKRLVNQCENELANNEKGYAICSIEKTNSITRLTTEENLNTKIHPASKFVISLDLNRIIQNSNSLPTPEESKSFCFVFYPVPVLEENKSSQPNYDQQLFNKIDSFYQTFTIKPFSSYNFMPADKLIRNVICTQPSNKLQKISFVISLPNSDAFLSFLPRINPEFGIEPEVERQTEDINQYGIKILSANKEFVDNFSPSTDFRTNLEDNYSKMIPLLILKYHFNQALYYK